MKTHLLRQVPALEITPELFEPFGQVIFASEDGVPYGPADAQLQLQNGIPRFYIMRLRDRGQRFHKITRHLRCTQCLGSLEGKDWLIGVASASDAPYPNWEAITAFRIPGNCFIKLEMGTWHAGPYFEHTSVDFYNLELSDTNLVDHDTCDLLERFGVEFEILASAD
ncbi:ureidoglycolate lyase [Leptothermofonsia sp. ETS-13]|uniref:ureidoglycolate lyase n=1 Tax=Leptothermofonsia sp. ETS-13 TaxID=3035696 RepID=UPI003BA312CB